MQMLELSKQHNSAIVMVNSQPWCSSLYVRLYHRYEKGRVVDAGTPQDYFGKSI